MKANKSKTLHAKIYWKKLESIGNILDNNLLTFI